MLYTKISIAVLMSMSGTCGRMVVLIAKLALKGTQITFEELVNIIDKTLKSSKLSEISSPSA